MAVECKYGKLIEYISYDKGKNWTKTGNIRRGELLEAESPDCMDKPIETQYKWKAVEGEYICDECGYNPDYYYQYLTIEATMPCTIFWREDDPMNPLSFSINNGEWIGFRTSSAKLQTGDKIRVKGTQKDNNVLGTFRLNADVGECIVYGNINSLVYGDDFVGNDEPGLHTYKFSSIFSNINVIDASNLILPAKKLSPMLYSGMFSGCKSLTKAPKLPATILDNGCYSHMFDGCTSLQEAPELNATILASGCYSGMFYNCTSLQEAPALPAKTLADDCYNSMFYGCTSLQKAPELNATVLVEGCYYHMFQNCTSLKYTQKTLPSLSLKRWCYAYMFAGCTSLQEAPELPALELSSECYWNMFQGCTSLTKVPSILPAMTLVQYCYYHMFDGCTSLQEAPELPAITLGTACYSHMFDGCTSLQEAPVLPARYLESNCYDNMFNGCTLINEITTMQLDVPYISGSLYHCTDWTKNTSPTGTIYLNKNITWDPESYRGNSGIPSGWEVIKI